MRQRSFFVDFKGLTNPSSIIDYLISCNFIPQGFHIAANMKSLRDKIIIEIRLLIQTR